MGLKNEYNPCCCILTILSALIAGIGISALFFEGLIVSVTTLISITLALGILEFLYTLITNLCYKRHCKTKNNLCIAPSIIGSITISIFALTTTTLTPGIISIALLIGAIAFFLVLSLINILQIFFEFICDNRCDDFIDK